ncbi:MAG: sugar ABC transporter permease [Defluviitaleaceae bacterium]|nr:sugar ABC transporter permease [Defluviitaleaceae bacterium]
MNKKFVGTHKGFLFVLPGFLGFCVFYLWPFVISIGFSFLSRPVGGEFVGLYNYISLLQNPAYLLGLRNTITFIGLSVPVNMVFSLWIAILLGKISGRLKPLFVLVFLLPLVIPSGSMVFFWQQFFGANGILNGFLYSAGFYPNWLNSENARFVLLTIFLWKNLGFNMVLFMSGLSNIPADYYEAAAMDGASRRAVFMKITMPCLMPTTVIVVLMSVINSFRVFREVYLLMGSHPHESVYMLQHFMNNNFFALNYPRLTTATTLLAFAMMLLALGLLKLQKRVS